MYHVILVAIIFTLSLAMWNLVHSAPRSVLLILPPKFSYFVGVFFLIFGIFFAFLSAYAMKSAPSMIAFFIQSYVGLWFLSVRLHGDEDAIRRMFMMMGVILVTIVAAYYLTDPRLIAMVTLIMVTSCFWLTTSYLRFIDRGH
jgi:hypothetical protein